MHAKLGKQPVTLTLCHIAFNEIPHWKTKIEDFLKEDFINLGFPMTRFVEETGTRIQPSATQDGPHVVNVETVTTTRWVATDISRRTGFILMDSAMIFATTDYPGFEAFLCTTMAGLNLINLRFDPKVLVRTGLRYTNLVQFGEKPATDWLATQFTGVAGSALAHAEHAQCLTEARAPAGEGMLVLRTITNAGQLVMPGDLMPFPIELDPALTGQSDLGRFAIIDIDHINQNMETFSQESVDRRLRQSHDVVYGAFTVTTTEEARQSWQQGA